MKILFITSTRLGDGVISTAALNYFVDKYPECKITVACGSLVKGIHEQFSNVEKVIVLKKEPYNKHWIKLWLEVYKIKWDIVVDIRNSAVSRLIFAKKKYIWGKNNVNKHKVEQIAEFLGTSERLYPKLVFKPEVLEKAKRFVKDGERVLAIGPTANWYPKTWPAENFIELIKKLDAEYSYDKIAIITAPTEEEVGYKVLNSIPENKRIDVIAKASPELSAAIISRCSIYIGNDSGLMHCAAATGIPTLGLFGPTNYNNYAPSGKQAAYISTPEDYRDLLKTITDSKNLPCLMVSLTVESVFQAAKKLIK